MLNNSTDILNITLAVCVAVLTFFICWGIYYFIAIIRNVKEVVDDVKSVIDTVKCQLSKIDHIVDVVHGKVENMASYMGVVAGISGHVMDWISKRQGEGFFGCGEKKRKGGKK